jgi:Flp pilus assembly protein TadG
MQSILAEKFRKRASHLSKFSASISHNCNGAVLVEAAIVLPILITILLGVLTYGGWFMAAHALQEVANDAARASVAGLDALDRKKIVDDVVAKSVLHTGTLEPDLVTVATGIDDDFYQVTLTYDLSRSKIFRNSLVPLPGDTIERGASVQLNSM